MRLKQDISEVMEDKIEKLEFENKIKNKNDLNLNDTQDINNSNLENKIVNKISLHKVIEKIRNCVNDLNVDNELLSVASDVIAAFNDPYGTLTIV